MSHSRLDRLSQPTSNSATKRADGISKMRESQSSIGWAAKCAVLSVALTAILTHAAAAAMLHVSAAAPVGGDGSAAHPFASVQQAADAVKAGDTVVIGPGVYVEHVRLKTAGTAERPIVFKTDVIERRRVILSGADPTIRAGVAWQCDDEGLQLFSVPYTFKPARVLYDDVDLLPYPTLQTLKNFRFSNGYPGTDHGFAFENGRLYVRLHPHDKYGPTDPNKHTMMVNGPIGTGGGPGFGVRSEKDYGIGVLLDGKSAFVTFDGFTFETPGIAAVYLDASDATIRNCWFLGCRAGVLGREESPDPAKTSNRVTIEYCDICQYPAFDDMKETIAEHMDDPFRGDRKQFIQKVYWWQRKGGTGNGDPTGEIGHQYTYELGIGIHIGSDWVIRNNYMHDGLEFLSCWATRWSRNLQVYDNKFERLIDNAVEAEDHASYEYFHDNDIVDVFEPFSWQPLDGHPWPGPIYFYRNLVHYTPENTGLWTKAGWTPGIWKLGAQEDNWKRPELKLPLDDLVHAEGAGFVSFNNTVIAPDHVVMTRVQKQDRRYDNFHIFNNVIVAQGFSTAPKVYADGLDFAANLVALVETKLADAAATVAGTGGRVVTNAEAMGLKDSARGNYAPTPASPAAGLRAAESSKEAGADAGATPVGGHWISPTVGPQQ